MFTIQYSNYNVLTVKSITSDFKVGDLFDISKATNPTNRYGVFNNLVIAGLGYTFGNIDLHFNKHEWELAKNNF